jgi:hypothetical protein
MLCFRFFDDACTVLATHCYYYLDACLPAPKWQAWSPRYQALCLPKPAIMALGRFMRGVRRQLKDCLPGSPTGMNALNSPFRHSTTHTKPQGHSYPPSPPSATRGACLRAERRPAFLELSTPSFVAPQAVRYRKPCRLPRFTISLPFPLSLPPSTTLAGSICRAPCKGGSCQDVVTEDESFIVPTLHHPLTPFPPSLLLSPPHSNSSRHAS